MNKMTVLLLFLLVSLMIIGCKVPGKLITEKSPENELTTVGEKPSDNQKEAITLTQPQVEDYKNQVPQQWGEEVAGVKTRLNTKEPVVALTLDACGGSNDGYDRELIDFMIKEKIPATLFINSRWIDKNQDIFFELSQNPLFEIENHGYRHKPLSVNGKSAYGIKGTANAQEASDEVYLNAKKILGLTGRKPKFFRSGTAYYDELAVKIVQGLGEEVVGYSILGDAGATYSKGQVKKACLAATPGSIILCHMNHPEKETAEGLQEAIPELKRRGFRFVKLEDYGLY